MFFVQHTEILVFLWILWLLFHVYIGVSTSDLSYQRGVRYTYRYSTIITTTLHGSNAGRNGLALDCVVDIDVVSKCHLMMQVSFDKKKVFVRKP